MGTGEPHRRNHILLVRDLSDRLRMARWPQQIPELAEDGFGEARIGLSQRHPLEPEGGFQVGEINQAMR